MDDDFDIAGFLERTAPPSTPGGALEVDPTLEAALRKFDGGHLTCLLSGLQTERAFQANHVRLEWATRLALALGTGSKLASREELGRLLNVRLKKARVTRLEDPIEDVMIEPICTSSGEFLIFTGTWEKAGHYTESVVSAFSALPEGTQKQEALGQANALLRLSHALVKRSSLSRYEVGSGQPNGDLALPPSKQLTELGRRVIFRWTDLIELCISMDHLAPFLFNSDHLDHLLEREPGDSFFEFCPLLLTEEGIFIAAPSNLSTAIRGHLIDVAIDGGMKDQLLYNILKVQSKLVDVSGLVRMRGPISPFAGGFGRQHVEEISYGRYLHVLQVVPEFGDWPKDAFAIGDHESSEFDGKIMASISNAREFSANQEGFTSGISLVFLSGWGSGRALSVEWPPELLGWQVIFLSAHDGFILGGCEDGSVKDLAWMDHQFIQVQEQGFKFNNVNGFLNLFQWWRNTDYAFVPPHSIEAKPPLVIQFDTDLLLQARREALLAWDRRALPMPDGRYETVMRTHPQAFFENFEAIYGCYDLAKKGEFTAAVLIDDHYPVWFHLGNTPSEAHFGSAQATFDTLLSWALRVLSPLLSGKLKNNELPISVRLMVGHDDEQMRLVPTMSDEDIHRTIYSEISPEQRELTINLAPKWQLGLQRSDNYAEAAMAAALLDGVARLLNIELAQSSVVLVRSIVGGADARWRHGLEAKRAIEILKAEGLVARFKPIPVSISAFVKTGLVWATHPRKNGSVIKGKNACRTFLDSQTDLLLSSLRTSIRRFRRDLFVSAVLTAMQAALSEERSWNTTARALRAIHGTETDYKVSLRRGQEVNAVLRACSMLAELGLVECPSSEGRPVGEMDISELQAHAILFFHTADLIPAIEGGRLEPHFNISPTGDLLYDHGFGEETLGRSAATAHEARREQASSSYMERSDPESPSSALSDELERAVEAEYGDTLERFVALSQMSTELAIKRSQGVFQIRQSELIANLAVQRDDAICVSAMVKRLTLLPRSAWSEIPEGATTRDFDLAKFDRRYSLIGRPLLALDKSEDPVLIVAPALIERCASHNLQGAHDGTLQGEFWSSAADSDEVGHAFQFEAGQ